MSELPSLITRFTGEWCCEIVGEAQHGEVAIAVPVRRGDEPAVLKIAFPHPGSRGEAAALHYFRGRGTVRVLESDEHGSWFEDDFLRLLLGISP
ncbi:hypothetical protein OU415_01720 [Saccharopolyspora sp. WRP15-2]|uniref:Uncharacterized protein n=1 Tax=Saccharopolyspora oryzae TaxID=2997343 RepID=A0ABT4UR08_9PSEU|nr:aminoglycoside phosphotransferase family protein [Saccharopolyspora oryzae]MDA3624132.1 hypothetical protein [Saccharopolyspora oryzae]